MPSASLCLFLSLYNVPAANRLCRRGALAFMLQQVGLGLQAAGETGQFAGGTEDSVARRNDAERVAPNGGADCACRRRISELLRDLGVGARLAERNGQQRFPHAALEFRAAYIERH